MPIRQGRQPTPDRQASPAAHTPATPQVSAPLRKSVHPTAPLQRALQDPQSLTRAELLNLHRTMGNQAVGQLLRGRPPKTPIPPGSRRDDRELPNTTGLPNGLKVGIEALAGVSLDDVTVHYHSPEPMERQALAYTQGRDIYVAPGQERHLPHEAWHVVQQAQGRVHPTRQLQGGGPVNDDTVLEREADAMGARAAGGAVPHAGGQHYGPARPASGPTVVQRVDLPADSTKSLETITVTRGSKKVTARALQTGLIARLSEVGEEGLGYRLVSLRYDGQDFQRDDNAYHQEAHGMQAWPKNNKAKIDNYLADIKLLVEATLTDAGQLQYLDTNFQAIDATHNIIIDVDWYRARTQSDVGFHKDSRGTTLFVNLTYDNPHEMYGASTRPDPTGQKALEEKLPKVVRKDLAARREFYAIFDPDSLKEIEEDRIPAYARVSFSDPSIWHSTPLLGHRLEHAPAPSDEATLKTYLVRAGYPVHFYRGILNYYALDTPDQCQAVFQYMVAEYFPDNTSEDMPTITSKKDLEKALRKLGMQNEDLDGFAKAETPQAFWEAIKEELGDKLTDKYNKHGISNKIQPANADELTQQIKGRRRALSIQLEKAQRLEKRAKKVKNPDEALRTRLKKARTLQENLKKEAAQPRTFIRTWVRLVPRPSGVND